MFDRATVDDRIFDKFPEYCVALIKVSGIENVASNERSEKLLLEAETSIKSVLAERSIDELEEIKVWRDAYAQFGVKPRTARVSFEALIRRVDRGLPRINLLTDVYNAVSILYRVPIGGENFERYQGQPKLVFAAGDEIFQTRENGVETVQYPEPGEVIWRDEIGVTCRRWNWRQCTRTQLDEKTKSILFIIDGLGSDSMMQVQLAVDRLFTELKAHWPNMSFEIQLEQRK